MKIVFATNNINKLKEVRALLPKLELLSLQDIQCFEDIPETAKTIEGNSMLKANYITSKYGLSCFADDTGLEINALNGAPGVYSARYAGQENNASKNMEKVLKELESFTDRTAQFKTVITLNLNGEQHLFEGICKGTILKNLSGNEGFGYDPIFQPDGYTKSFAEMNMSEKGAISHRGLAVQKLISFLNNIS
ncbi:non-canonical purine NTP diphosphatase [Bacteroidota bacterium]